MKSQQPGPGGRRYARTSTGCSKTARCCCCRARRARRRRSTRTLAEHERVRALLIGITSIASLGGLPQVSLPLARVPEGPVGLSLLAGRGCDTVLLDLVAGRLGALPAASAR